VILAPDAFVAALPDVLAENANIFGAQPLNAQCGRLHHRSCSGPARVQRPRILRMPRNAGDGLAERDRPVRELSARSCKSASPIADQSAAIIGAPTRCSCGRCNGSSHCRIAAGIDVARLRADADAARAHLERSARSGSRSLIAL
jgi:hypothetical protein